MEFKGFRLGPALKVVSYAAELRAKQKMQGNPSNAAIDKQRNINGNMPPCNSNITSITPTRGTKPPSSVNTGIVSDAVQLKEIWRGPTPSNYQDVRTPILNPSYSIPSNLMEAKNNSLNVDSNNTSNGTINKTNATNNSFTIESKDPKISTAIQTDATNNSITVDAINTSTSSEDGVVEMRPIVESRPLLSADHHDGTCDSTKTTTAAATTQIAENLVKRIRNTELLPIEVLTNVHSNI